MNLQLNWIWILVGVGALLVLSLGVWLLFFRTTSSLISSAPTTVDFGISAERPGEAGTGTGGELDGSLNTAIPITEETLSQKIFQVAEGPVAGAVLIQTTRPTTTLARFMLADSGRVFDLPLDVAGAIPRAVSNTTIPGIVKVWWAKNGTGAVAQYASESVRKTLYLGLMSPTTTLSALATPQPTRIQYLPDNIINLALSPSGTQLAYLLPTASGVDGYTALVDGSGSKKLFSLPLSQLTLSWPSTNTLLVHTKTAFGSTGVAFSVDTRTGAVSTLFFASTLSAIADKTFSRVVYQTVTPGSTIRTTYVRDVAKSSDRSLSFGPIPEKCTWAPLATSTLYCANPLSYVPINYLDLWNHGVLSVADALLSFNIDTGTSNILATPGTEGGVESDMIELSLSPDEKYLSFIRKGDRSVWAIRLE